MARIALAVLMLFSLFFTFPLSARENAPADPAHTWDLTEIYPSPEAWEQDRQAVIARCETILARRGTLDERFGQRSSLEKTERGGAMELDVHGW